MNLLNEKSASLSEVHETIDTTTAKHIGWRRIFSFLGPAYLVSVGYMDPGNWATDLAGGSKFGYKLIWVLLMSNLMALLLQGLSARLGIVRGRDLAQANRETFPRPINFALYILAEIAIAATDLAEVLGMAIGIQLLTGLPLIWGVSLTILDTFLLLYLQRLGMKKMEAFIIALVAIIAISFFIELALAKPVLSEIATGFVPSLPNNEALYIAIGIIGATVMPHNLYLHSALVQTRKIEKSEKGFKEALRFNRIDTTIALNIAFLVNASILILAATVFFKTGNSHVAEIKEAHRLLPSFLGNVAPVLFAVALIASGQSSTVTGTLAGQIVMEGYLRLRINPMLRRLITRLIAIIPAFFAILIYGETEADTLLVLSQVILSLQLGFAIIPLIHFVSDKSTMGNFAIKGITKIAAWLIASVLVYLNIRMLINEVVPVFQGNNFAAIITISIIAAACLLLLLYIILFPLFHKKKADASIKIHGVAEMPTTFNLPVYNKIAVALDFSTNDYKIITYALGQGNINTQYLLLHIVESASARLHGKESADYETQKDMEQLQAYIKHLSEKGYKATAEIGYNKRVKEIVRIVKESQSDLLVIGAHGHTAFRDLLYGETVNAVRHQLKIPVLVVTLK
ncbi:MAG: Nramp family divalent metal transporter [Chitinophagaceae bacterium]|jgi:manganese transport protein|nr:Nramp family divalent metal transporter [Chitinophagaceae bacterium]MBP6047519.1 Nramp family divalent metal transporter [Ferruginibacter sp.]MBK7087413.1 Nramp family divalent metal transporter [Chitinophagaceae bacterium]MBK7346197.1 Nramp family divalent metal transporter [Chitinophagaceae bacterium]MBK7735718.1 Nramp family divalent metal transporter [Chitinophagaceae bacterium]